MKRIKNVVIGVLIGVAFIVGIKLIKDDLRTTGALVIYMSGVLSAYFSLKSNSK